ncbi:hypothetical protein TNCV_1149261, partial [Trichonephila clavipes]
LLWMRTKSSNRLNLVVLRFVMRRRDPSLHVNNSLVTGRWCNEVGVIGPVDQLFLLTSSDEKSALQFLGVVQHVDRFP